MGELLNIVEKCQISAPANSVGERSLALTFYDLRWLLYKHPVHQLFLYDFHHSRSHFVETVIPNLKQSLSTTLEHFFLFASNLIVHTNPTSKKPEFRHVEGDSLMLTFAESDNLDFNYLKGDHPRECDKFHPLVPLIEGATKVSDFVKMPVCSIQVTLFPNSGVTIGITNNHALCDARSKYAFLMAWTSIAKYGTIGLLPSYDRVIICPNSLDDMLLKLPQIKTIDNTPELVDLSNKVRATFVLTRANINWLKKWLLVQLPTLEYVSSFVVGCAYVWTCIAKSRVLVEGKNGEYEVERFSCSMDWRSRLDPPVPQTYFGNCVWPTAAQTQTTILTGDRGFPTAVKLLEKAIRESNKGMFEDAEILLEKTFLPIPTIGVAGTPKLNVYNVDFGWGKPKKYEVISLDYYDSISVNVSKDSPEELEISLRLPPKQMDAFLTISRNELESILSEQFI
ncbi:transferase, Chloramphenicol acetyltransferase-like domain protein [Artemisia annua]|uniref:Transferase, Chloramphenicol acetyltransferase-like domain protein n=1 Tax=Artemisia annua TaxID=35608 RepID=A0A2U1LFK2_ARTAN|nr:transferase, Chloramphenicol acetyltransferase-like domain protein [Artemisia annua]